MLAGDNRSGACDGPRDICVSVLSYWVCAGMCPDCQMVGVLGLESLVLVSQTGETAWAPAGRSWSPEPLLFPAGVVGLLLLSDDKLQLPQPAPH